MSRNSYSALIGLAAMLMVALVGAPLWDHWHYGALRSGLGPSRPVALLLAGTQDPPLPGPTQETRTAAGADRGRTPVALIEAAPVAQPPRTAAPAPHSVEPAIRSKAPSSARPPGSTTSSPRPLIPRATSGPAPSGPRAVAARKESPGPGPAPPQASPDATHAPAVGIVSAAIFAVQGPPPTSPRPGSAAPPANSLPPAPQDSRTTGNSPPQDDPPQEPPDPNSAPAVGLTLSHAILSPGETVSVSVVLTGGERITSLPFHLQFNSEILEYVGARVGSAFAGGALQPVLLASVNPARPGDLAVGLSLFDSSGSFTGSGSMVVLEFRALRAGSSDLAFEKASLRGLTSERLPVQFKGGSLSVR